MSAISAVDAGAQATRAIRKEARSQQADEPDALSLMFLADRRDRLVLHRLQHLSRMSRPTGSADEPASSCCPICCSAWRSSIALGFEFVNGFHDTDQCRRDRHLHALAAAADRRRMVGAVSTSSACLTVVRPGRLRHRLAAAGRIDPVRSVPRPVSRWSSRCSSPRSSGTSAPGGWACPLPRRIR